MCKPSGTIGCFRPKTIRAYEGNIDGCEPKLSEYGDDDMRGGSIP